MAVTLKERVRQLKEARPLVEQRIVNACEDATIRAVEKAADLTPPGGDLSGTHTRTGEMKQRWASDSTVVPVKKGRRYETSLANSAEYASYVNDGHRMDRHFVPGLYINEESGLLEFDPGMAARREAGIVVGTKTKYGPGLFMVDAAASEYRQVLRQELADIGEILG